MRIEIWERLLGNLWTFAGALVVASILQGIGRTSSENSWLIVVCHGWFITGCITALIFAVAPYTAKTSWVLKKDEGRIVLFLVGVASPVVVGFSLVTLVVEFIKALKKQ